MRVLFYKFAYFFLSPLIKKIWVANVSGLRNLPFKGPVIIAANHTSYLDFITLAAVVRRRLFFLAAEKFFQSPLWFPLMWFTGQIRVDRKSNNKENVYKRVKFLLNKGHVIALFPEGSRSRTGKIQPAFDGAVKFAHSLGVMIIPVGIIGAFEAWPPQNKFPFLEKRIKINFGSPIIIHTNDYKKETVLLMQQIQRLTQKFD